MSRSAAASSKRSSPAATSMAFSTRAISRERSSGNMSSRDDTPWTLLAGSGMRLGAQSPQDVGHVLHDRRRLDAALLVVLDLEHPATLGERDRRAHRVGHPVGVEDGLAVGVARGASDRLDEGAARTQEALLVGVQDGDQRDLGQVEPLAQEVDADQDVELAEAQGAQDLDALDRVDVAVQVLHAVAGLGEEVRQVLGHALGQGRDQDALVARDDDVEARAQVVDLVLGRHDRHHGVEQSGRSDHLFDDLVAVLHLERPGRRRDEDHLGHELHELVEVERSVVERARQSEAVLDQRLLARTVPGVLAADLGHGDVGLVDHER